MHTATTSFPIYYKLYIPFNFFSREFNQMYFSNLFKIFENLHLHQRLSITTKSSGNTTISSANLLSDPD